MALVVWISGGGRFCEGELGRSGLAQDDGARGPKPDHHCRREPCEQLARQRRAGPSWKTSDVDDVLDSDQERPKRRVLPLGLGQ